ALAVGLGPVGPGALVGDRRAQRGGADPGTVAGAVVGQHPSHRDPGGSEERVRAPAERRSSLLALIGQQLTVGEARVVIDGVVDVPVAHARAVLTAGLAAQHLVAPAVGDAPELLD